jgi:hypothetical protein
MKQQPHRSKWNIDCPRNVIILLLLFLLKHGPIYVTFVYAILLIHSFFFFIFLPALSIFLLVYMTIDYGKNLLSFDLR